MARHFSFQTTIRTPQAVVFEQACTSLRVPTHTGQIGLRPRVESCVLAVDAGLIALTAGDETWFAGTAGGLLHTDGHFVSLLTPLAVAGRDIDSVSKQLDALLTAPNDEMEVRRMLGRLEKRILQEVQQGDSTKETARGLA